MTILYSVIIMSVLGLAAGTFLAFAAAKFAVKANPKEKLVEAVLPGANCGACGFPGCAAFAKSVSDGSAPVDGCIPGRRAGVPDKIKVVVNTDPDKLSDIWEKSGEDVDRSIKELFKSSGKPAPTAPKRPTRPGPEEIEKHMAELEKDPKAKVAYSVLPKINCGICGSPGCAAFAKKLANGSESAAKCVPGKRQNVEAKIEKINKLSNDEIKKLLEETKGNFDELKKKFEE